MSTELDSRLKERGTRFRLFAQSPSLTGYRDPETVWISSPAGSLRSGPGDARMQVLDAIGKQPYDDDLQPPWSGPRHPAAEPDAYGHFDHHPIDSRAFNAAHMFGAIRRVLDIWEDYVGGEIDVVPIEPRDRPLELIPLIDMVRNAQTGPGYIETGYTRDAEGREQPLCLNLDVLAHEVGHRIVFDQVGVPFRALTTEFLAFAESASDLVALVAALHFDTVIDNVLEASAGNLYVVNELNRFAEISDNDEIRIASNSKRMSDVADVATPWYLLTQPQLHEIGEPLTGALFDIFVDLYHRELIDRGAIPADLGEQAWSAPGPSLDYEGIQDRFDLAYDAHPQAFRQALLEARDAFGQRLARTWRQLRPDWLTFGEVAVTFLTVDRGLTGWRYQDDIVANFVWRGIGEARPRGAATPILGEADLRALMRRRLCAPSEVEWRPRRRQRRHPGTAALAGSA